MSITTGTFIKNELARNFNDIHRFVKGVSKLPKDVVIHYLLDDGTVGPKSTSSILKDLIDEYDAIYVHNILEIDSENLHGRKALTSKIRSSDKEYFSKYRTFSRVHNLDKVLRRANAPIIMNYNHIFFNYKSESKRTIEQLYQNMGNFATLWRTTLELETESVQLIPIRLPRLVKDFKDMKILMDRPTQANFLKYTALNDIFLYSLMTIIYADEYSKEIEERNVVFRLIDGLNHVDIPYKLIAKEIDKEGSSPDIRLKEFYDIVDVLIDLRVVPISEEDTSDNTPVVNKKVVIDTAPRDILDVESNIEIEVVRLKERGVISDSDIKRIKKDSVKYKDIKIDGVRVEDILAKSKKNPRLTPKSTVPSMNAPIGESLRSNIVQEMDKTYINETMEQDIIENIISLSSSGHMVLNIEKKEVRDSATHDVEWSIQTRHVNGSVGTSKFTIPKFKEDGTFRSGGVQYRMGRQRMTQPIVKIRHNEVAMTSSRTKMFATTGHAAADNLELKLVKEINVKILDGDITGESVGHPLKPDVKYGIVEGALRSNFTTLTCNGLKLNFTDGHTYKGDPVKLKENGDLVGKENYGSVLSLLGISKDRLGKMHSEVRIKGARLPISIIVASWMGLGVFLDRIGVKATEFDITHRVDKSKGPVVRFKDAKIQLGYSGVEQELLINGLLKYEKHFREIERDSMDRDIGWRLLFTLMGLGRSQERGIASIRNTWIDVITHKLLIRQGYPTEMSDLFLAVNKLLSDSSFKRETDGDTMFIRGHDRVNDLIYRELMVGVDEFDSKVSSKRKLSINPRAVKLAILQDTLVGPTEDTSPINQISNQTRIGYSGTGGCSDRVMRSNRRAFDPNDLGVISEAGTDDGKAGTILNTPVNPNFDSIYGTSSKVKQTELGNVLSINSLTAPFALNDEMKRVVFARIQSNAMIYAEGYRIMPTYTGGGMIAIHQCNGNYGHIAEQAGKVLSITDKYIEFKYDDGTKVKKALGRSMSRNSGKILPKKIITDYKAKDTFRAGAVLAWDTNYFARSMIDRDQVDLYTGAPVFIAIKEETDTYEDGSAIDQVIGEEKLATNIIHARTLSVGFKNGFKLLVKEGDHVDAGDPIALITPEGVDINENVGRLDFMSQVAPKAKSSGNVIRIEVNYIGDKKNATKGVRSAIAASDKQFAEESEYKDVYPSGEIKEPTFINQEYLDKDTIVVTLYIEHLDKYGIGDKSSDCNALKTVNGYAWQGRIETLDGQRIHGKFSGDGIFRRVVTSAFSIGLLNFCQYTAGREAIARYRGTNK